MTHVPSRSAFPAGLALAPHKRQALARPIVEVPPPDVLCVALDQGSGTVAVPVVAPGDHVTLGTVIARDASGFAATLHAPVSGRVRAIENLPVSTAQDTGPCVVIENDGRETRNPQLQPGGPLESLEPDALIAGLGAAGIAGLGGAAFPAATKLAAARARQARVLVLNGAECEPWICCDDAMMREHAADVVLGAQVLMRALGAGHVSIAVEDDKSEAIAALRAAIAAAGTTAIEVTVLPAVYPAGAERQLLTAVTGVEVPTLGLPADVGVTCQNVATAAAAARWFRTGEPSIDRIVTVTGSAVAAPGNVRARLGTTLRELVLAAGGYRGIPRRLIVGGSMTGRAVATDAIGLAKSTNCVLAASPGDLQPRAAQHELACIRCGDCAAACPAGLLPQQLHRAARVEDLAALERFGVEDCIECGCCDYVCPSQIPLTQQFRIARSALRAHAAGVARATAARERFARHERRMLEAAESERREFAVARRRARDPSGGISHDGPADD